MRITIIQPALPAYRRPLFARMAALLGPGFAVYSSRDAALGVLDAAQTNPDWDKQLGPMRPLGPGLEWQRGTMGIPIGKGDVVVICGAPRTLSTLVLLAKCKLRGAKTIWWGHYWSATSKAWRARLRFAMMRLPDAIMFYTEEEVAAYQAQGQGRAGARVRGINNGVDTTAIAAQRIPYSPDDRPRDLMFLGRVTEKAGLGLLITALGKPTCAKVTLDVIGAGPELAACKAQAAQLGVADRILWHPPTTEEAEIAACANQCKAFVYPGGVGLSLIHAFAYGLPAIVHDSRWLQMPEVAAHRPGANGVTFVHNDADSLAAEIAALLSDKAQLKTLAAGALVTTQDSFNTDDMADRFVALIRDLQ